MFAEETELNETAMIQLNMAEIEDVSGALKVCYAPRPWWPWWPF